MTEKENTRKNTRRRRVESREKGKEVEAKKTDRGRAMQEE